MKIVKKSICIILALISILALNACGGKGEKEPETYPPAENISLETFFTDFKKNEIVAKETHEGKRYRITAEVVQITEDYVTVIAEIDINKIWAHLYYNDQEDFVKNIISNDIITFEGTFINYEDICTVNIEDVVFISKVDNLLDS